MINEELNDLKSRVDELEINTRDGLENQREELEVQKQDIEINSLEITNIRYFNDASVLEEEDYMRCPLTEMEKENRS